jgi:hypothetical protein
LSKLHEPDDSKTLKRKQKANARLEEKKKVVPNSGHHGAIRAGHETYPVGKPQTTEPKEAATRAPGHDTYFHEPADQPTQKKCFGIGPNTNAEVKALKKLHNKAEWSYPGTSFSASATE